MHRKLALILGRQLSLLVNEIHLFLPSPHCELLHFIKFYGAPNKGWVTCSKSQGIHMYTQSITANLTVGARPTHVATVTCEPRGYQTSCPGGSEAHLAIYPQCALAISTEM